jgi:hypothetical protein
MRKSLLILVTLIALGVSGAGVSVYADEIPFGCRSGLVDTPGYVCSDGVCCPGLRDEAPTGSVDGAIEAPQLDMFDAAIRRLLLEFIF